MMQLDAATLVVLSGLVSVICGVSFVVNTVYLRSDGPGRLWSMAYIAAIMSAVSYAVHMYGPDAWWAVVVGHVMLAMAVGGLWSGLRLYNGRGSLLWVALLVAGTVAASTLLHGPGEHEATAMFEVAAAVALLSGLGCVEATRGALRRNLNGRILAFALGGVALFSLARAVLFMVANDLLHAAFAQAGIDHLDRARERGAGLAMIGAEIDNLPAINAAFGRDAGDEAISEFARTLRAALPVMSLIGHRDAGRFLILVRATSPGEAVAVAGRIRTAMVQKKLPRLSSIRLTASFGIADTLDHGHDLLTLRAAADAALGAVQKAGGNDALLAPAPASPVAEPI